MRADQGNFQLSALLNIHVTMRQPVAVTENLAKYSFNKMLITYCEICICNVVLASFKEAWSWQEPLALINKPMSTIKDDKCENIHAGLTKMLFLNFICCLVLDFAWCKHYP
jgi:hypothetical protein